ncbi:Glucose-methanol-choline oxidoreductase [Gracilaria domingensis]|nr:Glucose-methanol-choline oxidoreductase [Gracilaria domingensis]
MRGDAINASSSKSSLEPYTTTHDESPPSQTLPEAQPDDRHHAFTYILRPTRRVCIVLIVLTALIIMIGVALTLVFVLLGRSDGLELPPGSWDYVVVGAGTSGCVLASRLCAAFPKRRVLLLERGAPRSDETDFLVRAPRKVFDLWSDRSATEAYPSESDEGLQGRFTTVLTGITMGGSSSINGMQWTVPLPGTVESWGINGLDTERADMYYRKAFEKVKYSQPARPLQYAQDYIDAGIRAGYAPNDDPFKQPLESVWQNFMNINDEFRRNDACAAYLEPVKDTICADNLQVLQGQTASKIIFSRVRRNDKLIPVAVETIDSVNRNVTTRHVARRQIIVTAGPYGSAQLLQLSGIGPKSTLEAAGIEQVLDLPVGEQCVGRAAAGISSTYNGVPDEEVNNQTLVNSPEQREIWDRGDGGVLGTPVSAATGRAGEDGYFNSGFVPFFPGAPQLRTNCFHNTNNTATVRVRDADAFNTPRVKLNLLRDIEDVRRLQRCLRKLVTLHNSFAEEFNMTLTQPVSGVVDEEYIRSTANTGAHFVGCCGVGGVLDGDLRVKGTTGLRVVDASSLRTMPRSSGPAASVLMLAEFVAHVIRTEAPEHGRVRCFGRCE